MIDLSQEEIQINVSSYKELVQHLDYINEYTKLSNLPNKNIYAEIHETETFVIRDNKLKRAYRLEEGLIQIGSPYDLIRPRFIKYDIYKTQYKNI